MASKNLINIAMQLAKQLGANTNKFLGTRTNISFLGKGPQDDLLFQQDINPEAMSVLPLSKILPQIESSMSYLTGGKLNDLQANKLISNLQKMKEFHFPPAPPANITDLASGTGNLTPGGLEYLRLTGRAGKKVGDEIDPNSEIAASIRLEDKGKKLADSMSDAEIELRGQFPRASDETISAMLAKGDDTVFGLKDYDTTGMPDIKKRIIELEEKLGRLNASAPGFRERAKPLVDELEALQLQLKGGLDEAASDIKSIDDAAAGVNRAADDYMTDEGVMASETILPTGSVVDRIRAGLSKIRGDLPPPGSRGGPDDIAAPFKTPSNEIDALETMTKNKAGAEFITGFVDDVYKNSGVTSSVDVPKKRAAAREFLYNILKKETDLLPPGSGGTLESVISQADYKYVMEGGGGALGDPLILVKKYFGDTIAKRIPLDTRTEVIDKFVENVRFAKDRAGFPNTDPRFNPDDIPDFVAGGRVGFKWGSGLSKALLGKINKKMIKDAVDDIFPTGDYKYDAQIAAEALVENNPKLFGGKLMDDLNDHARSDVYGLVLGEVQTRFGAQVRKNVGIKSLIKNVDEQFGEGTLKRASDVTPSTKYDDFKAVKDFEARNRTFSPNREKIKAYYQGKIDDELLDKILADNNPQRIAEILATIDEALLMQQRGIGSETIIQSFKDSWGRKKNAHGGLAKILEV